MPRTTVTTIRFTKHELKEIERYLRENPIFSSISSLGRVATLEFIHTKPSLTLSPRREGGAQRRPWFLWDYDLSDAQVREILAHAPFDERKWLITRILDRMSPPEVFQYLSLDQIQQALPHLRLPDATTRHWQEAIALWTNEPSRY